LSFANVLAMLKATSLIVAVEPGTVRASHHRIRLLGRHQFAPGRSLTASEVSQLKLNAEWVVLSACNTAAAENPGAEALSGLVRAFFCAGGRSLLVSNWEDETKSAVSLMAGTFTALAHDRRLSHADALQNSMLAMINDNEHPERAEPRYWPPFIVVGEPASCQHLNRALGSSRAIVGKPYQLDR
jgi:CHAT domain-containing protein